MEEEFFFYYLQARETCQRGLKHITQPSAVSVSTTSWKTFSVPLFWKPLNFPLFAAPFIPQCLSQAASRPSVLNHELASHLVERSSHGLFALERLPRPTLGRERYCPEPGAELCFGRGVERESEREAHLQSLELSGEFLTLLLCAFTKSKYSLGVGDVALLCLNSSSFQTDSQLHVAYTIKLNCITGQEKKHSSLSITRTYDVLSKKIYWLTDSCSVMSRFSVIRKELQI